MAHLSRQHGDTLFDFPTKIRLQSQVSNLQRRSATFRMPEKSFKFNIWDVKPLDLNPQAFEPKPPKRNTREAIRPWTYTTSEDQEDDGKIVSQRKMKSTKRKEEAIRTLEALRDGNGRSAGKEEWKSRRFRSMDAHEARVMFVKEGMYKAAPYQMPKPFNHRQYEARGNLELPDFVTKNKDGGADNDNRRTVYGPQVCFRRETEGNTKKDYEDRHRRTDRTARSAYLDRAEEMMKRRKREIEMFKHHTPIICKD